MLYESLLALADRAPPTSGVRLGERFSPYAELAERATRLAAGFAERGIVPGTSVALLVPNGPDLFAISYGLFAVGAIAVPLGASSTRAELLALARKAHVGAVIARPELAPAAEALVADLAAPGALPLFLLGGDGDNSVAALERYAPRPLAKIPADVVATYMFSSGSTGLPKVVPHTHGELDADADTGVAAFGYRPDDVMFNMLPGNHAMGFIMGITQGPRNGTSITFWNDPAPLMLSRGKLLHAIAEGGATILPGVPFLYDVLSGVSDVVDLSRLRIAYSSGVLLKREVFDRFRQRFGIALSQVYGMTEACFLSFNNDEDLDASWDSVGRPAPGIDIAIEPVENAFGPDFGEIVVSSRSVTKGYLDQPAVNANSFRGGRFHTGDLARIGPDGNIYIKGRSKLLIEVAGHKIDPYEIEEVLAGHPAVAEAVVVGVPDPRTGEQRLKAVVVRAADEAPEVLIRYCRERLSSQKVPNLVEFRDALPRSATGKVLRGKLMEPA